MPKALGIFASTGLRLDRLEGSERHAATVREALELLLADTTAGPEAWGYHWDMQTRWSFYPAGSPNVVVTAFAFAALREAAERWPDGPYAERAERAARWVVDQIWLESGGHFVYHPGSEVNIHNANLLAARMAAEAFPEDTHVRQLVKRAVERTLAGQHLDGSFPYGVGRNLGFVDCFHTGYVLDCLSALRHVDPAIEDAIGRGASYWLEHFFREDGGATLWPDKRYPEDAHSSGTALTTLAALDPRGLGHGTAMARLGARALSAGLYRDQAVFRRYGRVRTTVRYMRWCDAHLALGLANAAHALTP